MKKLIGVIILLVAVIAGPTSLGAAQSSETDVNASARMKRKAGAYLGFIGDPYPTLVGVNVAYNFTDFLRATAGLGRVSVSGIGGSASATTLGAGARFMVPGWSITPVAGISLAYVSVSGTGVVKNFSSSGAHAYFSIGADWQASNGFNVGLGYNVSVKSGIGGLPYLNLGWFFDFI